MWIIDFVKVISQIELIVWMLLQSVIPFLHRGQFWNGHVGTVGLCSFVQ